MKSPETKAKEPKLDFHFSGGTEYAPISITAKNYEEAFKLWEKKRTKIRP